MLVNKVQVLCHASGWCNQSQQKLAEWREQRNPQHYAIRWDGPTFTYETGIKSKSVDALKAIIVKENQKIFDMLYKSSTQDYDVPCVFSVTTASSTIDVKLRQGYSESTFITSVFPMLKNNTLQPGTFVMIYMENCEHLPQYMPVWNAVARLCDDFRTGLYQFEKKIYNDESKRLLSGQKITNLPVVMFMPLNKTLEM